MNRKEWLQLTGGIAYWLVIGLFLIHYWPA
jgi:hypothetical protein